VCWHVVFCAQPYGRCDDGPSDPLTYVVTHSDLRLNQARGALTLVLCFPLMHPQAAHKQFCVNAAVFGSTGVHA
jgi:hypothetical protein